MSRLIAAILPLLVLTCGGRDEPNRSPERPEFISNGIEKCSLRRLERELFGTYANGIEQEYQISVSFVGLLKSSGEEFSVYYYDQVRLQNYRGTHRVLILKPGCTYVGQYVVSANPLRVSGADILFDAPAKYGNVIHFENGKPPKQTWVDGENPTFFK